MEKLSNFLTIFNPMKTYIKKKFFQHAHLFIEELQKML